MYAYYKVGENICQWYVKKNPTNLVRYWKNICQIAFYPLQKGVFILYRSFWTARNNLEKTEKIYKNNLTYLISMLLYNHVENTYITDMNNGGTNYEQDFRYKTVGIGCNG